MSAINPITLVRHVMVKSPTSPVRPYPAIPARRSSGLSTGCTFVGVAKNAGGCFVDFIN
jgi:hypothetical protein